MGRTKKRGNVSIEIRKQVSFYVPLSEWKALVRESARLNMSMTALVRQWIAPRVDALLARKEKGDESDRSALGD